MRVGVGCNLDQVTAPSRVGMNIPVDPLRRTPAADEGIFIRPRLQQTNPSHDLTRHAPPIHQIHAFDASARGAVMHTRTAAPHGPHEAPHSGGSSGPASITLWPFLAQHIRVLIYNGDADACVPYVGNEEWIDMLEEKGVISESEAWKPWFVKKNEGKPPAGYVTKYDVAGSEKDFHFVTIRLAGHMVPTFQPEAALAFIARFFRGEAF